jgi:hypothetical protein
MLGIPTSSPPAEDWILPEFKSKVTAEVCSKCGADLHKVCAQTLCFECRKEQLYSELRRNADRELASIAEEQEPILRSLAAVQEERALLNYRRERLEQNISTLMRQAIDQQRSFKLRANHWKTEKQVAEANLKAVSKQVHDMKVERQLSSVEVLWMQEHTRHLEKERTKLASNLLQADLYLEMQESVNERLKEQFAAWQHDEDFSLLSIVDEESDLIILQSELTQSLLEYLSQLTERETLEHKQNAKRLQVKQLKAKEDMLRKAKRQVNKGSGHVEVEKLQLELEELEQDHEKLLAEVSKDDEDSLFNLELATSLSSEQLPKSRCSVQ